MNLKFEDFKFRLLRQTRDCSSNFDGQSDGKLRFCRSGSQLVTFREHKLHIYGFKLKSMLFVEREKELRIEQSDSTASDLQCPS